MKNILIIGGAGFIGSELSKKLIKAGHTVDSLDNYSTGTPNNHVDGVTYYEGEAKNVEQILIGHEYDIVFHFGEYSRVEQSFGEIDSVFDNNNQLIHVIQFCHRINAKLIYAGSSTIFTDFDEHLSPYTFTKAMNVKLLKSYTKWNPDFKSRVTYFYNVYGGENEICTGPYATVIAKFKQLYLNQQPLTVTLPGTQVRNFTHVDDVVAALMLIIDDDELVRIYNFNDLSIKNFFEYSIANPKCWSILEVAAMFKHPMIFTDPKPGNRDNATIEHLDHMERIYNWSPQIQLDQHIKEFLNRN